MNFYTKLDETTKHVTTNGAFLTVGTQDAINCMTISWGFIGFFWGKAVFIAGVRPQRHTKTLLDRAESFTVSVPFGHMQEQLQICGTKSGAQFDKSTVVTYAPSQSVESPVIAGCDVFYECKRLYAQPLNGRDLPVEISSALYNDDYHIMYYGEIVSCYEKQ